MYSIYFNVFKLFSVRFEIFSSFIRPRSRRENMRFRNRCPVVIFRLFTFSRVVILSHPTPEIGVCELADVFQRRRGRRIRVP